MSDRAAMGEMLGEYLAWHAEHQRSDHAAVDAGEYWRTVAVGIMDGMAVAGWVMVPAHHTDKIAVYEEMLRWLVVPDNLALMRAVEPELVERLGVALGVGAGEP